MDHKTAPMKGYIRISMFCFIAPDDTPCRYGRLYLKKAVKLEYGTASIIHIVNEALSMLCQYCWHRQAMIESGTSTRLRHDYLLEFWMNAKDGPSLRQISRHRPVGNQWADIWRFITTDQVVGLRLVRFRMRAEVKSLARSLSNLYLNSCNYGSTPRSRPICIV